MVDGESACRRISETGARQHEAAGLISVDGVVATDASQLAPPLERIVISNRQGRGPWDTVPRRR
jgi:hypothetical protein